MPSTFFNAFRIFYLEIVILIIGILLGYIFHVNPLAFVFIAIIFIISGGVYLWVASQRRAAIKLESLGLGSLLVDIGYIVLVIILTIVTIYIDIVYFNEFGFFEVTIVIAILTIISSLIIIILVIYIRIIH